MNDVIKDLIQMDRKAMETVEAAKAKQAEFKSQLAAEKEKIQSEYAQKVESQIKTLQTEAEANLQQQFKDIEARYHNAVEILDKKFGESKDQWIDEIADRCMHAN